MIEEYVFCYKIDGKTKRECVLSKENKALLLGGLHYAKTKDFDANRRKEYECLIKELNLVANGEKWKKRKPTDFSVGKKYLEGDK